MRASTCVVVRVCIGTCNPCVMNVSGHVGLCIPVNGAESRKGRECEPHRWYPEGRQHLADLCLPLELPCVQGGATAHPGAEALQGPKVVLQCPPVDRAPSQPPASSQTHSSGKDLPGRPTPQLLLLTHPPRAVQREPVGGCRGPQRQSRSSTLVMAQLLHLEPSSLPLLGQAAPEHIPRFPPAMPHLKDGHQDGSFQAVSPEPPGERRALP